MANVVTGKTTTKEAQPIKIKGLYDVAQLAQLLCSLGYVEDSAEWEAEYEGDESPVPAMLHGAMQQLGAALIAMTQEEVAELLAEEIDDATVTKGLTPATIVLVKAAKTPLGKMLRASGTKAGRVISKANETKMRDAIKSISDGHAALSKMLDDVSVDDETDDTSTTKNSESGTDKAAIVPIDQRGRDMDMLRLKAAS